MNKLRAALEALLAEMKDCCEKMHQEKVDAVRAALAAASVAPSGSQASGAAGQANEQLIEKFLSLITVTQYEIKDARHENGRPHVTICGFALKGRNSRTLAHAERRAQRLKDSIRAALASAQPASEPARLHEWQRRPCEMCTKVSAMLGRKFGCVAALASQPGGRK